MENKSKKNLIFAIILIALILGASIYFTLKKPVNYLQGQIESKQTIIAPLIAGRVASFHVNEGDTIKKGDLIATIETPGLQAKLTQAKAAKMAAESQLNKANAGARKQQVQAAYNKWQTAKTAAELAKVTYERVNNLFKEKVVSEQKKDEAFAQFKARRDLAKAAKAIYDMAKQGARQEDKQAAQALVNRAGGVIDEVNTYEKETKIYAPVDGIVQELILEEGEVAGAGTPIANLINTKDIWMIINVREDKLNDFIVGKEFNGSIPALDNEDFTWKVKNIAVLGDFATWTATKASGDFDKKTFKVKAYPTKEIKGLRPGMSVLVLQK